MNTTNTTNTTNEITIIEQGTAVKMNDKGKKGSFARAIAFASRDARMAAGQTMYIAWLKSGTLRPIVNDILDVLVPKAARPYIGAMVPAKGPVPKEQFVAFCRAVDSGIKNKGSLLSKEKMFVYEIVRRVAEEAATHETVIEAPSLRRAA